MYGLIECIHFEIIPGMKASSFSVNETSFKASIQLLIQWFFINLASTCTISIVSPKVSTVHQLFQESLFLSHHSASGIHQRCCSSGTASQKFDHISTLMRDELQWLRINKRIRFKLSILVPKCQNNSAPSKLIDKIRLLSDDCNRLQLQSSKSSDVFMPGTRTKKGHWAFTVPGTVASSLAHVPATVFLQLLKKTKPISRQLVYGHLVYQHFGLWIKKLPDDFPCWNRSWSDDTNTISLEAGLMQGILPN